MYIKLKRNDIMDIINILCLYYDVSCRAYTFKFYGIEAED